MSRPRMVTVAQELSTLTARAPAECAHTLKAHGRVHHCALDDGHRGGHRWFLVAEPGAEARP